jgi:STE24 endopeptidase
MTPVNNTITRTMEAEADAFGLNAARQPDGFARAAVQLSEYRKMQPGAVEEFVFYDHPSGWNRIHRAMIWKAEHLDDADIKTEESIAPAAAR